MMEGWKEYRIDEIADVVGGGTPSTKVDKYWNGEISWITPNDLSGYAFKTIEVGARSITKLGLEKSSAKLHPINTILFTSRAPIGYLAIAKREVATNQGFQSLRCKSGIVDYNFMYYYLSMYKDALASIASGSTFPELSGKKMKQFKVSIPPLSTQYKIASILSAYDDLIENNLQRIKLLEEMAQQTYTEWFLRMKFPGHESVEWDEETGLPEGWEKVKIEKCLAKVKSTVRIKTSDVLEEGDIPVIDQSRDFIKGYTNNKEALLNYDCPLIVFGDHTRILKLINFPFARGADGTQVLLSKDKCIPQHFFYFSLMNVDLSNYHYARHFKFLKEEVIIRPIEDIALKFESLAKNNFEAIKNLRSQNQHLKEARDILLPRLMTGMIEV